MAQSAPRVWLWLSALVTAARLGGSSHTPAPVNMADTIMLAFVEAEAATEARLLDMAWTMRGEDVYNHIDHAEAMPSESAVAGAKAVVLLQTQNVTACGRCLLIAYWAVLHHVPLIPVNLVDGGYSFWQAKQTLINLDQLADPTTAAFLRSAGVDLTTAAWRLGTSVPYIISTAFDATGRRGTSGVGGQVDYILSVINAARPSAPGLPDLATFTTWRADVAKGVAPAEILPWQPDPRHFQVYISHYIAESGKEARLLKDILLQQDSVAQVFLDVDDMEDLRQEATNVNQSDAYVVLATARYLQRPYCLLETYTSAKAQIPIVLVDVEGKGFDRAAARQFLETLQVSLEKAHPGSTATLLENGVSVAQVQQRLLAKFDSWQMLSFNNRANLTTITSQVATITCTLRGKCT